MKTLYININNEEVQSNEELEVLNYDLDSDFFFYLGENIAKGCKVENENALITEFNTLDNAEDYQKIIAQWNEIKTILFSEECKGEFEFTLPDGYIHWLRYSEKNNYVYEKNFSHCETVVISIDLEELYEESVEDMQRKILCTLKRNDLYLEVDEIVFNDDVVTRKSSIVLAIKEKYDSIGFKAYKKWLQENEDKPHTTPQVCKKCGKNPCECNTNPISSDKFFPYKGFTLGETLMKEFKYDLFDDTSITHYNLDNGVQLLGATEGEVFIAAMVDSTISSTNKLPKEWCNILDCRFGTFREKCRRALGEKEFEIILDEDAEIIVVSPSKKYRIHLAFDVNTSKFVALLITLNECPHCKSNNFALRKINAEMHISYCTDCYESYLPFSIDESEDKEEDIEVPSCPNCGSDDVEDDGSDYLQYTCNDGHNWGHDDTVECPECGSDDVENDGTGNMQYKCNACGEIWGDCEGDDDFEDDKNEINYDHPLSLNDFFPVCGVTLNKTTVQDVERQSYRYAEIEYDDSGLVIAWSNNSEYGGSGSQIRKEKNSNFFTHIYMSGADVMFPEWSKLGFDWSLSYDDWISLFKRMGFTIIQTEEPQIKSWEHGPDYFYTNVVAISKDYSLKFELKFSYGRDGNTLYSRSTLYSIGVYSKDYSYDYGGHIGKKTFYNIEDFLRKEPKKYL